MIGLLINPVGLLLGILAATGSSVGFEAVTGHPEHSGWLYLGAFIGTYLLSFWLLPWWTRPFVVWRWWRSPKPPVPAMPTAPIESIANYGTARYCTICGTGVAPGDKYCATCGVAITQR